MEEKWKVIGWLQQKISGASAQKMKHSMDILDLKQKKNQTYLEYQAANPS